VPPVKPGCWAHEKLADPRAKQLLKRMMAELMTGKLTGALLAREFVRQRLAPLQAHSRPLWTFRGAGDELSLHPIAMTDEELSKVVHVLLDKDPGGLPEGIIPLYDRTDGAAVAAAQPVFNTRGLIPLTSPHAPPSSASSSNGSDEEEGDDSEATHGEAEEASPPQRDRLLHDLPDDDEAEGHLAKESSRSTAVTTRSQATPPKKKVMRGAPKKDEAVPPLQSDTSALPQTADAARSSIARLRTPKGPASPAAQVPGAIALLGRKRDFASVSQ
jgi:hypothetical protein